jgi:hypothetical protein
MMGGQQSWALSALVKDWKCVTVHLESVVAEEGNASFVAKNLIRKLTNFKFVYMIYFLLDYLVIFKNLSQLFQGEQLFLSTVVLHAKNTVASVESLKLSPGQYEE